MTDEDIFQEIGKIVTRFRLLECQQCAREVRRWLKENGISGKVILLKTEYRKADFIFSNRLNTEEPISENGRHYAVEVRGRVFDNLSSYGLYKEDWLKDFFCGIGGFIIEEIEVF
jgi:hypothetical protein